MPGEKRGSKDFLSRLRQGQGKRSQVLRRFGLWSSGKILRYRLHLMELAVLHRNALCLKNLCHTSFSVDHRSGDMPPLFQKLFQTPLVYPGGFKLRFVPPQILFKGRRSEDHDAVSAVPEGHVGSDGSGGGFQPVRNGACRVKLFFDPHMTLACLLGKLRNALAAPHICTEESAPFSAVLARSLKRLSTGDTTISLQA